MAGGAEWNDITSLPDKLLVEIFCRLPSSKFAIQCKCVCKRWAALISRPCFISRFVASKQNDDPSMAIVARSGRTRSYFNTWNGLIMHLEDPVLNPHKFTFASLPCSVDGDLTSTDLTVFGACNDLLLYCKDKREDRLDFYIYNVQTKQWLQLPSLFYHGPFMVGFICDPYYSYEGGNPNCNVILNAAYRYSIVVICYVPKPASMMSAYLFSSETSQWNKIVLSLPQPCMLLPIRYGFDFAGMLHFRTAQYFLFGFDPYSGVNNNTDGDDIIIECHLIPMPAGFVYGDACTGLRQGCLQMFHMDDDVDNQMLRLQIWVLKDYEKGEWYLQHNIAMNEFVPRDPCLVKHLEKNRSFALRFVLGQHPINPDIIYVLGPYWIVLFNVQNKTLEVASRVSAGDMHIYPSFNQFQLMLPIWPTPLPTIS